MNELNYWVRLSLCFEPGSDKPELLLQDFETPGSLFESGPEALDGIGYLTVDEKARVLDSAPDKAERILDECRRSGIRVVTKDDSAYPDWLRESDAPPCVLYLKTADGSLGSAPAFTVTGSRELSEYGRRLTGNISYELARAGAIPAAGFLTETDRYVHLGALRAGRGSIAVLDRGIDQISTMPLKDLADDHVIFLSELPPGTGPAESYRTAYVRLLTGISLGTLVTQLGDGDPYSDVAERASMQGKELYCVPPGDLFDPGYSGVIRFLREGAAPVFCAKDLLKEYEDLYPDSLDLSRLLDQYAGGRTDGDKRNASQTQRGSSSARGTGRDSDELLSRPKAAPAGLDETEKLVYNCMEFLPKTIAEISEASCIGQDRMMPILNGLVKKGFVVPYSGARFGLLNK